MASRRFSLARRLPVTLPRQSPSLTLLRRQELDCIEVYTNLSPDALRGVRDAATRHDLTLVGHEPATVKFRYSRAAAKSGGPPLSPIRSSVLCVTLRWAFHNSRVRESLESRLIGVDAQS